MSDKPMKCPRCQGILCTVEHDGVMIEACADCKGEWLHPGELDKIAEHHEETFSPQEIASLEAVNKSLFTVEECEHQKLRCPACETVELDHFNYCNSSGVILHKCPDCGGLWMDKDQLEQVEILVDEWKKCLQQDTAAYGSILQKIEAEETKELDQAVSIAHSGVINAVLCAFFG